MGKKVVTIDELIDLAIGTPESAVNFLILQKVLRLITRYCCKMDHKFEFDLDNIKGEITAIRNDSRSSFSESQGSYESNAYSGHSEANDDNVKEIDEQSKIKVENDKEEGSRVKVESDNEEHSTERKTSESGSEQQKQSEGSSRKDSEKDKEKKESRNKREKHKRSSSEKHRKRSSENARKKDSESNKQKDSGDTKKRMRALEDFTKNSDNRANELENQLKELTNRIDSITQTIQTHLDEKHLAEINEEIEKMKANMENTTDQCYEVTNTINDQSSQIQEIVATINNIQLRKVENEELIDLLSGKADHSFVNEKVSTSQFEEIIQELKDVINESTTQMESVKLETNTSIDEIKQELLTKLLAEEFDTAKAKIYKELIKLTEQHALILAQQNEHVAAGAKMRNLNCFACDNDVVMLLEEEIIPKFRGLKASLQPLEPIVGSKLLIDKNTPEWKNHQLKAKDFTRTSKASRFYSDVSHVKATYVKGKNGCMYKGNVGCDCVEGMAIARTKREKCCSMVEANNLKNISQANKINCDSKVIGNTGNGDVAKSSAKIDNKCCGSQKISTSQPESFNLKREDDVQPEPTIERAVKVEKTLEASEEVPTTDIIADPNIAKTKMDINTPITSGNATMNVPDETNATPENDRNTDSEYPIDENLIIKSENIESDNPIDTNNITDGNVAED